VRTVDVEPDFDPSFGQFPAGGWGKAEPSVVALHEETAEQVDVKAVAQRLPDSTIAREPIEEMKHDLLYVRSSCFFRRDGEVPGPRSCRSENAAIVTTDRQTSRLAVSRRASQ
jgi:hypothetical protein